MHSHYQLTALVSAIAFLLVNATPQNISPTSQEAVITSITDALSTTTSTAETATATQGFSLCPVTDSPFELKFLTCATSPAFDSCSCNSNGLAYKFFFSCAFTYVQERTAKATTEQDKQAIKDQVQNVVGQYVQGCKDVGMPIPLLDITSGTAPPLSGGFTLSTATQVAITTSGSVSGSPVSSTSNAQSQSQSPASTTQTTIGNSNGASISCNTSVHFAAALSLLIFFIK